jgi:hypothetical protein
MDSQPRMLIDEVTRSMDNTVSRRTVLRRLGGGALAVAAAGLGLAAAEAGAKGTPKHKNKKKQAVDEGAPLTAPPADQPADVPTPTAAGRVGAAFLQASFDLHSRKRVGVWTQYRRYYGNGWWYGYVRDFATGRDLLVWYRLYTTGNIYIWTLI